MHFVCLWHKADILIAPANVRFWGIADIATKLLTKDGVAGRATNIAELPLLLRQGAVSALEQAFPSNTGPLAASR